MAVTYDGDNNLIFQISDASSRKVHQDSSLKSEWKSENGNSYPWEKGNGTGHSNTGNGGSHNHTGLQYLRVRYYNTIVGGFMSWNTS